MKQKRNKISLNTFLWIKVVKNQSTERPDEAVTSNKQLFFKYFFFTVNIRTTGMAQ